MQTFDKTILSDVQSKEFEAMSEREKIQSARVILLKLFLLKPKKICSFNENNFEASKEDLESLARAFLPDIIEYFKNKKDDVIE